MPKQLAPVRLPTTIYVTREPDEDSSFLLADDNLVKAVQSSNDEDPLVGTYQLVSASKYTLDTKAVEL